MILKVHQSEALNDLIIFLVKEISKEILFWEPSNNDMNLKIDQIVIFEGGLNY